MFKAIKKTLKGGSSSKDKDKDKKDEAGEAEGGENENKAEEEDEGDENKEVAADDAENKAPTAKADTPAPAPAAMAKAPAKKAAKAPVQETTWSRGASIRLDKPTTAGGGAGGGGGSRDASPTRSTGNRSASPARTGGRGTSPTRGGRKKGGPGGSGRSKSPVKRVNRNISKKSKFEEGLSVIDEILLEDSDAYKVLTVRQRKALADVKNLLLAKGANITASSTSGIMPTNSTSSTASSAALQHVPHDLIFEQRKEQRRRAKAIFPKNQPRQKMERPNLTDLKRGSTYFILQEYAGVKTSDPLLADTPQELQPPKKRGGKKPVIPASAPPDPGVRLSVGGTSSDLYTPQEFKDLPKDDQQRLCELLSWDSISSWGFDIFELNKITKGQPLLFMGWAVLGSPNAQAAMKQQSWKVVGSSNNDSGGGYTFMEEFKIPPQKLCNYLRTIEKDYHTDNPYHNNIHAADVVQALNTFIQMSLKADEQFLKSCTTIQLFSILLSAVVHDVDHPGMNNAFQTKLKTELAVVYNDQSVLENWHVACAFARMLNVSLLEADIHSSKVVHARLNDETREAECNVLGNVSTEDFDTIRNLMIEAVLHTDMSKHFAMVDSVKGMIMQMKATMASPGAAGAGGDNNNNDDGNPIVAWKALMYMLHMADISNQAKAGSLARMWTERCMNEFFAQGDQEAKIGVPISPNCDRSVTELPESQVAFIKFVVQPAYAVLGDLVPTVGKVVLPMVQANLDHWTKEKEAEEGSVLGESADDLSDYDDLLSCDGK